MGLPNCLQPQIWKWAINNLSQRLLGKAVAGYTEKFIPSIEALDDNFYLSYSTELKA